jgi:hypothetical protein
VPKWKDLRKFLKNDKWTYIPSRSGTDDVYQKVLNDGTCIETRVSKSSKEIGPGLFAKILKSQVRVSKEYFNSVLSNGRNSSDDPTKRMV